MRKIHWPSFWRGFQEALATPAYATIAFAGVFRRVWKSDPPGVFYDARSMWWTYDEQEARRKEWEGMGMGYAQKPGLMAQTQRPARD